MYGGPRLYRFYNYEQIHYIAAPTQGWNPDAPAHELPVLEAPVLDNFLIQPGKIVMRGPFTVAADLSALAQLNVCGYSMGVAPVGPTTIGAAPSAAADDATVGTVAWATPTGVEAVGGTVADASLTSLASSHYLKPTGFGFNIPAGATILGITVSIRDAQKYAPDVIGGTAGTITDQRVSLLKAGVVQTTNKALGATWVTAAAPVRLYGGTVTTYGGPADMWGTAWTPADINSSTFGMVLQAQETTNAPNHALVDYISISVTYQGAGTNTAAWVQLSRKALSSAAQVDHWNVPLLRPTLSANLGVGTGTQQWLSHGTNTTVMSATARVTATPTPGPRWISCNGLLYGLSYDDLGTAGTANDVSSTYITWKTKLMTQPLVQSVGTTVPTLLSNAPQGAYDVASYLSRIWLLGGINTDGGGTTHSATTLFWAGPTGGAGPLGTTASDWKDPISGFINFLTMDNNEDDFGVALARVRNGLIVLRRESIWLLSGTTTSTFVLRPAAQQIGCLDARSVVETDVGVYFMSRWGLMLTNGVTTKNVSGTVLNTLQQALAVQQQGVLAGLGGYISVGETSLGQLLVSIGGYTQTGDGRVVPIWCGLYDPRNGTWVRITSKLWAVDCNQSGDNNYPGLIIGRQANGQLFTVGNIYLTRLEEIGLGYSFVVPGLNGGAGLYDLQALGSTGLAIPALWVSRFAIAGVNPTQHKFGQAKRFFADYTFAADGLIPTTGWSVQPINAAGTSYGSPLVANLGGLSTTSSLLRSSVSGGAPRPAPVVQRQNQDLTLEIDDVLFAASWDDVSRAGQPVSTVAELYGIGLEFQRTRDLR
jgi:hypothetical protein